MTRDDDQPSTETPAEVVWLGPGADSVARDRTLTGLVCSVPDLQALASMVEVRRPRAVVCFLEHCDQPASFVHLLVSQRVLPNHQIYVWPATMKGMEEFRKSSGAHVVEAWNTPENVLGVLRTLDAFSILPAPRGRLRQ